MFQSIIVVGSQIEVTLANLGLPNRSNLPNNPNFLVIQSEEGKLAIGIDKVRQLQSFLAIKATNTLPKVALIAEAEGLTEEAQNALLKILEEPPENTYLILQTTNSDLLLPTVVSRCQIIHVPTEKIKLSEAEQKELKRVLAWIEQGSVKEGFAWAKNLTDRAKALETIDKLIYVAYQQLFQEALLQTSIIRSLFKTKKYLQANTNVRLTLENLFLD